MKDKKIKLSELKVSSFVTEQSAKIRGGERLTEAPPCFKPMPLYSDKCKPSEVCEASFEAHCAWTKGKYYCG
ncbi:MAG: pinensin family lanthipeptide [Bacteroidota bacterium]